MVNHVWTVLCTRSVLDRDSNNASIQNVLEQINVFGEPAPGKSANIGFELISLWVRAESDVPARGTARITFTFPSGKRTSVTKYPINLIQFERSRNRVRLVGMPAMEQGRHDFHVELLREGESEWQEVASIPVSLVFLPAQATEETTQLSVTPQP